MEKETLLRLEAVVQKMLGNIDELKKENNTLELQLSEKNNKIDVLEERLAAVTNDQEHISTRVSSLISSIEEWEKNDDKAKPVSELADLPIEQNETKQEAISSTRSMYMTQADSDSKSRLKKVTKSPAKPSMFSLIMKSETAKW